MSADNPSPVIGLADSRCGLLVTDRPFCYIDSSHAPYETTMICQHCGAGIPDDSKFCTYCGAPLVPQDTDHFADPPVDIAGTPVFSIPYRNKLSLDKLFGDTFELYKRNFGTMCLVGLIFVVIAFAFLPFSFATEYLKEMAEAEENRALWVMAVAGDICFSILHTILMWYIMLGVFRQCLYLARSGIGLQARMLFPPFMLFLKYVGLVLVVTCIVYGILLLCLLPAGIAFLGAYLSGAFADNNFPVPIMVPLVVCVFVGGCVATWVGIRLYLAPIFIADRGAGIGDAIKDAWRVSSGNFWRMFLAVIVLAIVTFLGYFLCCVGIILTIAIGFLGHVLIYLQLTGQPNCLDYPPVQY
jgi:hypothetical protein